MLIIEIILIACITFAGISIVLTSMKTGISPSPSSGKAVRAMLAAIEDSGTGPIVDLGSGWGTLVIALAGKYPNRQVVGYELSLVLKLLEKLIIQLPILSKVNRIYGPRKLWNYFIGPGPMKLVDIANRTLY